MSVTFLTNEDRTELEGKIQDRAKINRINLIDKNNVVANQCVYHDSGVFGTVSGFWRTDFIEIEPNTEYTLRYVNQVAFYADKDASSYVSGIGGYSSAVTADSVTFTTPSNAKYIVVCGHNQQKATVQLEKGGAYSGYRDYDKKELSMDVMPPSVVAAAKNASYSYNLSSILRNATSTVKITLIGDSITHGAGGTGFNRNGEEIDGVGDYRNPDGYCWANLLKADLEAKYNCTVTNNALTGTDTQQLKTHVSNKKLIHGDEDIVICMYGTNNRTSQARVDSFISDLQYVYDFCKKYDILFIPMASVPASVTDEEREDGTFNVRFCHMEDINAMINSFCVDNGISYIDVFTPFYDHCFTRDVSIDTLLADGLHPNNDGHYLIYRIVCKALGVVAKIKDATW